VKTDLTGSVRVVGEGESALRVEIHLEDEELLLVSGQGELGRWPLSDIGVAAKLDGFHLRIEGEELVISTNDDARFALALGIRSSNSPRLNRLVAGAMDDTIPGYGGLADSSLSVPLEQSAPSPAASLGPLIVGLLGAAAAQALAAIVAVVSESTLKIFGIVPAWPIWVLAALAVGFGAMVLRDGYRGGRRLVAAGVVLGLITLAGSLLGLPEPEFSWITDGVAFGGAGTILAGLLLSLDFSDKP
jgi:hypothetical protein